MLCVRNLFVHRLFIMREDNPLDPGNSSENASRQQYIKDEDKEQKIRKLKKVIKWAKILYPIFAIFTLAVTIIAFLINFHVF